MNFMITKYNNTNEVLFVYQEESKPLEEEKTEEVFLVLCNPPANLPYAPYRIDMLVELDDDDEPYSDDENLGLLNGF